jgi:excisionase family DNA binding protein
VSQELYSVEQVAERLGLHVKTVRNYVRDGRLKAVRIGKQYRVARGDLEALTGQPVEAFTRDSVAAHRHVEVSSIVEIDGVDRDTADRVMTMLTSLGNGRRQGDEPLRIETIYDPTRARFKVIVVGGLAAAADLLKLINVMLEARP